MKTGNALWNAVTCLALAVLCTVVRPAEGITVARPVEYSLAHAHVIVVGKIVEVTSDKRVKRKAGNKWYTDYYRLGYVKVDEVLKNDLAHVAVERGDRVEIQLGPTAKRAKALARERAKDPHFVLSEVGPDFRSIEKGDGGIWRLYLLSPEQLPTFMLSGLTKMEMLREVKDKLVGLDREYQDALKNEIPRYAEEHKKFLSTPASTQTMVDAAMGRAMTPRVGPSDVNGPDGLVKAEAHDKDQGTILYGFADTQGNTVIPPKFLHAMDFCEGLAAIETTVWAERTGLYGNPAIELSEKAARHILLARWGFINEKGEIEIPPLFDGVGPFQNGLANVRIYLPSRIPGDTGVFEGLIDKAGRLVLVTSNPLLETAGGTHEEQRPPRVSSAYSEQRP